MSVPVRYRLLSGPDSVTGIAVGSEVLLDGYVDGLLLAVLLLGRGSVLMLYGRLTVDPLGGSLS